MQLRRTAATAEAFDLECELISPDRARELLPVLRDRRPARRDLAARRRHGQPDRRHAVPGPRRPAARRPDRRARRGSPASRRRRRRGHRRHAPTAATSRPRSSSTAPASGPRRSARCAGSRCRCTRPSTSTSSPTQIDGRAPRPADPARPGRLHLLQGGGRRPRRRRLRARGQAVGRARPAPLPVRVPAARRGLGPLLGPDGERAAPHPRAARDRRSRSSTTGPRASRRTTSSSSARRPSCAASSSAPGFNSVGIATGGRRRPRARRVDRRGRADERPVGRRHPPVRAASTATTSGCTTGSARSSACTTRCRGPSRELESARPFRRSPVHHLLAAAGAPASARRWAGSGPTSSRRRGEDAGRRLLRGASRTGWTGPRRSRRPPASAVALFDQTSFGKILIKGRDAETLLQWLCTADVAVPPGRAVYTGPAQRARRLRGRRHRHPDRPRRVPARHRLGVDRARPGLDRAAHPPRRARRRGRRHVVVRGASGSWGPRSRELLQGLTRADLSDEAFPFAHQPADRPRLLRRCGRPGSRTSASWAGSCTSRPSSRSASTSC